MTGDIKEELNELGNMAIKLQQDIEVLHKERDGLQNEIANAREKYKKDLDIEYAGMKAALQAQYDQLLAEEKDKIAQANEKLQEASIIHAQNKEVLGISNQNLKDLETRSSLLDEKFSNADREIASIKARLSEKEKVFEHAIEENVDLKAFLITKKSELDNKEFQLEQEAQKVEGVKREISDLLRQNEETLNKISGQIAVLQKEKKEVLAIYAKIKAEKEELLKLQSLKNDIVKLEALKKEVEEKQTKLQEVSKALATKEDAVREKELSSSERSRLLDIRDREISGKIEVLNKLRTELAKNA
jgi:chromosome segregation ATPase